MARKDVHVLLNHLSARRGLHAPKRCSVPPCGLPVLQNLSVPFGGTETHDSHPSTPQTSHPPVVLMARRIALFLAMAASVHAFDVASVTPEMLRSGTDPNQQSARSCLPYLAVGTHGGICPGGSGDEAALDPLLKQLYSAPIFGV